MLQSLQVPRQWSAPLQAHVHAEGILWLSVLPLPLICNLIPEAPESSQDPGHQASLKSGGGEGGLGQPGKPTPWR